MTAVPMSEYAQLKGTALSIIECHAFSAKTTDAYRQWVYNPYYTVNENVLTTIDGGLRRGLSPQQILDNSIIDHS